MNSSIKSFDNLLHYQNWVNEVFPYANGNKSNFDKDYFTLDTVNKRMSSNPKWFGDTTYKELSEGITTYKEPDLIEKIKQQVQAQISASTYSQIKKRKIQYNAVGMGVFCFDRAAMGFYQTNEFYSTLHKKVVKENEIRKTRKGYELIIDNSEVIERLEQRNDGRPKIRTSSKYVFAYYPKTKAINKTVELFLACGASKDINSEKFLYSGISAIIVAEILEKALIKTKINVVFGTSPNVNFENTYSCIVPVKNYEETLDTNLIALLSSDPRFFRYDGFKGIMCVYHHFGIVIPSTLGYGFMDKKKLQEAVESSDYGAENKTTSHKLYMGWTFSEDETLKEINRVINELSNMLEQQ